MRRIDRNAHAAATVVAMKTSRIECWYAPMAPSRSSSGRVRIELTSVRIRSMNRSACLPVITLGSSIRSEFCRIEVESEMPRTEPVARNRYETPLFEGTRGGGRETRD